MSPLRFNVFGREVLVAKTAGRWVAYYPGREGKRRPAEDIVIPRDITEMAVEQYLSDLCHEWATEKYPKVVRLV